MTARPFVPGAVEGRHVQRDADRHSDVTPLLAGGSTKVVLPGARLEFDHVAVDHVSRHFGRRRALSHITFRASSCAILGLLGPNGAGKSTMIALLATLVRPSSGRIRYGHHDAVGQGAALRSSIGVLGHDLFLYPELTARENLAFFAGLHGLPDPARAAAAALDQAGLAERADDPVSSFSRGMRQRVALERALIHQPRLALLDEPFTGLDDASSAALVARLRALRESGAIVVLATHDLDLAEGLLDRAVFLRDGRVVDDRDRPEALRSTYRSVMALAAPAARGGEGRPGVGVPALPADRQPGTEGLQPQPLSVERERSGEQNLFTRVVWLVLRKDLTVEVRSLEIAYTTLFFAVACVLVFAFALVREGRAPEDGAPGILWIAIAFAGTLALGRTFERERQSETLRALLLAPAARPAIYIGKLLGIVALLLATEVVLVPLVALLFQAPLWTEPLWLAAVLVTGTIGFASVGTLFAAMLVRARSRDVLLPVLLYPITVPVIIAGVRATAALLQPELDVALVRFWVALLVCFDVVFVTLALWTFEPLMTD